MKKRDILFLCQFSYPETVSSATLPFDTAEHLAKQGYSVDVLCGYPKEYSSERKVPKTEQVRGVNITRLKYTQLSRKSSIGRLINYFSFTMKVRAHIRRLKKYKSVIVYSNPPVLPLVPIKAKKRYGTKFVFVAYDVYPEIAYASKSITRGNILDKVMKSINRKLYKNADAVVALTDEMRTYLLENREGLEPSRVYTIENWAHEKERLEPSKDCYDRFGFPNGKFIVSYFGNMGTCQDIDTLLSAAKDLRDNTEIGFLIVGHGNKKERVRSFVEEHGLDNVKTFDYLVGEDFDKAVAISNCYVVSLEQGLRGMCAPSKYYSYLRGGQPVIAVVEEDSYLARELAEERVGAFVKNGDHGALCRLIRELKNNPEELRAMGNRARALYEEKYSIDIAMKKYEKLFADILENEERFND